MTFKMLLICDSCKCTQDVTYIPRDEKILDWGFMPGTTDKHLCGFCLEELE